MLFFSCLNLAKAASDKNPHEFTFYNISHEDTMNIAAEKLRLKGFECGLGKSTYLGTNDIRVLQNSQKSIDKIEKIINMDKLLEASGKGLEFEQMTIDVLLCPPLEGSPFSASLYIFSGLDHKILAIRVGLEKFQNVSDKLKAKFGSCISEGYCEIGKSILILSKKMKWPFQVYFFDNLKLHYDNIKKKKEMSEKKIEEKLNEAF
jgi:hypothetical protein